MTTPTMTPIEKTVTVPLAPDEAFTLFLSDLATWWPGAVHSVSAATGKTPKDITVEPHKGGLIIETLPDGSTAIWGQIIGWEPSKYASFTWHPGKGEAQATVVAVSFCATKDGTRVDLTHGGFEILGDLADAVSTSYLHGWDIVLGCFCTASQETRVFA